MNYHINLRKVYGITLPVDCALGRTLGGGIQEIKAVALDFILIGVNYGKKI